VAELADERVDRRGIRAGGRADENSHRAQDRSTLARRIYRKLGVSSQAALAARLAGHARRKLGER
jgi:uncharacterized protein YqjF (DUF2071 family)